MALKTPLPTQVCGPKDMFNAVKETLTGAGVFETRVLSNF